MAKAVLYSQRSDSVALRLVRRIVKSVSGRSSVNVLLIVVEELEDAPGASYSSQWPEARLVEN